MNRFDFDNQDVGAVILALIAVGVIWQFQEIQTAVPGLAGTTLTTIVTAFIAWVNPKKK